MSAVCLTEAPRVRVAPIRVDDALARWHVLHTRARQEKAVARALDAAGIEHYVPLTKKLTYHGRTRRVVERPLFASYLFMYGPVEARHFALATKRVANVIPVADEDRFGRELSQIRRALDLAFDAGTELVPDTYLAVGRTVRVNAGPFRGVEGIVESRLAPSRLVLQVTALGRAVSLEIDAGLLEPLGESVAA